MAEVIVSQPEFGFRPTGGSYNVVKDCKSDLSLIQGVRGRTVSWNQKCSSTFPITKVYNRTSATSTGYQDQGINIYTGIEYNVAHQFYWYIDYTLNSSNSITGSYIYQYQANSSNFFFLEAARLKLAAGRYTCSYVKAYKASSYTINTQKIYAAVTAGDYLDITYNNVIAIDLTLIYGSGNEPTTPEAFEADYEAWFGHPLTYEAYCAGELRNLTATGIKTVGFNQLYDVQSSVMWNQICNDMPTSSSGVEHGITYSVDSTTKRRKLVGTATGSAFYLNLFPTSAFPQQVISGHKYAFMVRVFSGTVSPAYFSIGTGFTYATFNASTIKTATTTSSSNGQLRLNVDVGQTVNVEYLVTVHDLTLLFGEGKEPSTAAEFEAWLERHHPSESGYYPYDAGSTLTITDMESPVIVNNQYQLTGLPDDSDDDLVTIDGETVELDSNSKFTPSKSGTLLVQGTYPDACLHFVHSGRRDNEYEEHWESTKNLPITTMTGKLLVDGQPSGESVVVAPHGMLQAGSVKDEIRIDNGKRYYYKYVGDVDLGTQYWIYRTTGTGATVAPFFYAQLVNKGNNALVACAKYEQVVWSEFGSRGKDKSMCTFWAISGTALMIRDTSYTDAATFKTAMSGVMLNYELATPEVYLLDEEYQEDSVWSYRCDDWGTEFLVSYETPISHTIYQSAPLDADILYGSGPMKRYTVEFKDREDRTVIIDIADESTLGRYTSLIGAENPLEIAEDDDHDPLLPVRASVARIRVVCNYADLIQIRTDLQWSVRIQREGSLIWQGFLRTDMPDADLAAIPGEVFYIADDLLGCLKSIQKTLPRSRKTFKSLLERAYSFLDNSIPVLSETGKPWETLQTLSVEPWNWIEEEENEEGVDESVPDKANVVEEDILQFLGVCARYWNNRFYMGSLFGTKFYEDEAETTVEPIDGSSLEWTGFHSMKSEQGKGLVTVESAGREVEDESVPSFKGDNFSVESYGYLPPQTSYQTIGKNAYFRSLLPIDNIGVSLKAFTQASEAGNILGKLGAHILDLDFWETQQTDLKKANFTFTRSLLCVGVGLGKDGTEYPMTPDFTYSSLNGNIATEEAYNLMNAGLTEPIVTFRTPSVYAKGGGFTLKMEYSGISYSVTTSGGNQYRTINSVASPDDSYRAVVFSLKFGNMYWNSLTWGNELVKGMYRPMTIIPFYGTARKTIDFDFDGEGLALPVDGVMSGDVELCIYGCYDVTETEQTVGSQIIYTTTFSPLPVYNISTIDLKYHAPLSVLDIQNRDSYRCSQRTPGFPVDNAKDVGLTLCSDDSINDNWGWVYSGNNILKTLHWQKLRQTMKPEQLVLKKNVLSLSRIRSYANLSVRCEYDDLPFRRVNFLDRTWYPLAVSTNMRLCTSEVLMMDITDIMASLPAVGTDEGSSGGDTPVVATAAYQMVTLTLPQALDVPVAVLWSTNTRNGTATIETGQDSVTFDAGETIADERDISINLSATGYTFNITWSFT